MSFVRCGEHSRARLGSSDLRRVLDRARLREVNEARSGTDAARDQHRGRGRDGNASIAGGRIVALERRGVCECGASRRLLGVARACGHDRTGADFRRTNGIRKTTRHLVRRCRIRLRQKEGSDEGRRSGLDDFEDEHQILAGGISQPERDRSGAVFAQGNRRCVAGEIDA